MMHYSQHDVASDRDMCTQSTYEHLYTKTIDYKLTEKCVDLDQVIWLQDLGIHEDPMHPDYVCCQCLHSHGLVQKHWMALSSLALLLWVAFGVFVAPAEFCHLILIVVPQLGQVVNKLQQ